MRASDLDYRDQLLALSPVGGAWPRDVEAHFPRLLHGLADELARTHNRALDLIEEADPHTTVELLEDWERVAGFPDPCVPLPGDADRRRMAVVGRLAARGGQSAGYYTTLCASLGYEASITDYREFICGEGECGDMLLGGEGEEFIAGDNECGDHLGLFDWRHAWRLDGEPSEDRHFLCGDAECGDALGWRDNPVIRCIIARLKPEHTRVAFRWTGLPEDEQFPAVQVVEEGDFECGAAEVGEPLGYIRTFSFSAIHAPSITYD